MKYIDIPNKNIKNVIYMVTNIINGKSYIGQTIYLLRKRMTKHKSGNNTYPLGMAIRKYGCENFEVRILHKCSSLDELNRLEVEEIKNRNTLIPNGYNIEIGGNNKCSNEESIKKIKNWYKNNKRKFSDIINSKENRDKVSTNTKIGIYKKVGEIERRRSLMFERNKNDFDKNLLLMTKLVEYIRYEDAFILNEHMINDIVRFIKAKYSIPSIWKSLKTKRYLRNIYGDCTMLSIGNIRGIIKRHDLLATSQKCIEIK